MFFRDAMREVKKLADGKAFSIGKDELIHHNGDIVRSYNCWIEGYGWYKGSSFVVSIAKLKKEMDAKEDSCTS